ncbi:MAG TPA: FAD-dependent monooxygenase [Bacteroidia bacterium]|nr:FAD-dependent monooxygenase [Bacteroidia bacterium]
MQKKTEILIVGAGPSGLSVAIFLSELGYHPRIIDKKPVISDYSKALAVNPRTLEIFDEFNLTERFLQNGRKLIGVNFWKNEKFIFRNDFQKVKHKYPFLLIQPQKESEQMLLEELSDRKINVEYSAQFDLFEQNGKEYISTFTNGDKEFQTSDYIIGADGAHSVIRKQLQIEFEGLRYKDTWELYDVELDTPFPKNEAQIKVLDKGGMIIIPIKENLWRVAGNLKNLLSYLPKNTIPGKIIWESKFNISHNLARSLVRDNVVLIGDAAHLHSPIGGRGMNLGIEDAYFVSKLIKNNRLNEYDKLRMNYLRKTVNRINNITQFVASDSGFIGVLRKRTSIIKPFLPFIMPAARKFALGLDEHNKLF